MHLWLNFLYAFFHQCVFILSIIDFAERALFFSRWDKNVSQNNKSIPMTSRGGRQWWCDIVKYLKHTKNQSPQTPRCIAKRRGMMWLIFDSVNRNATIWRITWLSLIFCFFRFSLPSYTLVKLSNDFAFIITATVFWYNYYFPLYWTQSKSVRQRENYLHFVCR